MNQSDGPLTNESLLVPLASVRSTNTAAYRWRTRLWWLTAVCAIIAVGLVVASFRTKGEMIQVYFLDGHGLKVGDTLRYRGIDVGGVTSVAVDTDMQRVSVLIQLEPSASRLAVEGSEFWVQRPQLRIGQFSGLDTVLGAKYVGVKPGAASGKPVHTFFGRESPLGFVDGASIEARVQFPAGEGLGVGDPVRYRGIAVGEITAVELSESVDSVWVSVRLVGQARTLARVGTQFWIERPRLDLTEIRSLETIVSGRYLAVQPRSSTAPVQTEFIGLGEPPPLPRRDGSLEIELDAPNRLGLVRGAPIAYKGLEVGRVANVTLSSDGASVQVHAIIEPEFSELVRDNSKWWVTGGVRFDLGITGVALSIDSFSAWLRGGIAFATPDRPGRKVFTGHRFGLSERPEDEWLGWQPRIAMESFVDGGNHAIHWPKPLRVAASWKSNWFGFSRRRSVQTWALALDNGSLWVPAIFPKAASTAGAVALVEIAGLSFSFDAQSVGYFGELASLRLPKDVSVSTWPRTEIARDNLDKSAVLVVNPELAEPMAIDWSRVTSHQGGWKISTEVPLAAGLAGSPVVDAGTGQVLGLLVESEGGWIIASIAIVPRE